ncbi:DUF2381 family protein [Archangium gephyra]|uniref:DUF2381 family protein n=1 Tax=Archangium gephyra TaxID=48 RepID=UPI003B80A3F6
MRLPSPVHRAAGVALLVCSTVAGAQQPPVVRVRREQQLVPARMPAGSEPELRVAPGVSTVVRFDADVEGAGVKGQEPARGSWVDVATRALLIEPPRELAPGERLPLEVVLVQGAVRTRLTFQLVSAPGEVDTRVKVELRPRSDRDEGEPEAPAPRREEGLFSRFVLSGVMGEQGVSASMFKGSAVGTGVMARESWDYRAVHGRVLSVLVCNPVGARPWRASEAVPLAPAGAVLAEGERWKVFMDAPIEPGGSGLVMLEQVGTSSGAPVRLEVREKDGSRSVRLEESH